ncbi:DinB family protein [Robiginitalea marina]|uniref:DinB family protein n=1 Tax=Robiginitalea marina TaxID=2954105 RepID=A0ABT1AW72_9FLAO|nr:DinB family protein [Robiginitalea marina]MCO5723593.1 DinB family protein [Robiginitalea marina]
MTRFDLQPEDCPPYYRPYIDLLGEEELTVLLERQMGNFPEFIRSIPEDLWHYRYAEGKWTVSEVLVHVLDTERVFQYRALRFGRHDATPLPGFDQDAYVPMSLAMERTPDDLVEEYLAIRKSTLLLFRSMPEERMFWKGTASGNPMSLGALGFILCGHQKHHRNILRERYLGRQGKG